MTIKAPPGGWSIPHGWNMEAAKPPAQAHLPGHITQPPMTGHPAPKPPTAPGSLTSTQQSVYDLMNATLASWGLSSLSADLKNLIVQGDTAPDTLSLALSQTKAYKQRFAGNEIRKAQGLRELTPAEYIGVEEQYSQLMRQYGLPPGFYDKPEDFTKLIGHGVAPTELNDRLAVFHDDYLNAPPEQKALWSQWGFSKGDIIAGLIDPDRATQALQDTGAQIALAGSAASQGFQMTKSRAEQLQQGGVSLNQARQAYAQIHQTFGTDQAIASRFGQQFGQQQEEDDLLLGKGDTTAQRQSMYDQERALFRGKGAVDPQALSAQNTIS